MPEAQSVQDARTLAVKCASCAMEEARKVFDEMLFRIEVPWAIMISGYVNQGDTDSAYLLFDVALEECFINNVKVGDCFEDGGPIRKVLVRLACMAVA
ncbi:hypothetical protein Sjap_022874 [Stephania japonica]|uniref:Pentatricopeptide repeat-containing protein n=1 Tax=Stephania japonica TaxID=461633 RepID=A0AAP0HU10_9MAGN